MVTTRRLAQRRQCQQRDQRDRQSEKRFDDASGAGIDPTAEEAGDEAENGAEEHPDQRRRGRDDQNVACASHHSREHVAGRLVGAEPVRRSRAEVLLRAEVERVVWRDVVATDRADDPEQCDQGTDDEARSAKHEFEVLPSGELALGRDAARADRFEDLGDFGNFGNFEVVAHPVTHPAAHAG